MKINMVFFVAMIVMNLSLQAQTTQRSKSDMKITSTQPSKKSMKGAIAKPSSMGYQIGDKVENFELKSIDGKMMSLTQLHGDKGAILIFTCNECPYAQAYEQRIIELNKKMTPKGYPVIAINSNEVSGEGMDDMIAKSKEANFNFTYLKDDQKIYRKFGAKKTPEVFVLDRDHVLRYTGGIDDSANDPDQVKEQYVVNAVLAIDAGNEPSPAMTKAIGCSIKTAGGQKGGGHKAGGPKGPPTPEMMLSKMDSNGDKMISKDEVEGPLSRDFDNLDTDKNGMLNMEELSAMKKKPRGPKKSK